MRFSSRLSPRNCRRGIKAFRVCCFTTYCLPFLPVRLWEGTTTLPENPSLWARAYGTLSPPAVMTTLRALIPSMSMLLRRAPLCTSSVPLPGLYLLLHGGHGSPSNDFRRNVPGNTVSPWKPPPRAPPPWPLSPFVPIPCQNPLPYVLKWLYLHRSPVLTGRQHVSNTPGVQGGFARSENRQRQAGSAPRRSARPAIQSGRAEKRRDRFTFTVRTEARMHSDAFYQQPSAAFVPYLLLRFTFRFPGVRVCMTYQVFSTSFSPSIR